MNIFSVNVGIVIKLINIFHIMIMITIFFISKEDLSRLEKDTESVFEVCRKSLLVQKESSAQKEMKRLYKEFGEEGVLNLLRSVANDSSPDNQAG